MTDHQLGPSVARVGPLLSGGAGVLNIVGHSIGLLAGLGLSLPGVLALGAYAFGPDPTSAFLILGLLFLIAGVVVIAFVVVSFIQYVKLNVTVHEQGLVIGQPWFRTLTVRWEDVDSLIPPHGTGMFHPFTLVHRSGARVLVNRLCLSPRTSLEYGTVHHPDVQTVIDHHARWKHAHSAA
ncbi:hypothetical protein [Brevibacterium yomogidense]|uniref:hypothetical protein n=1 Tax=Brevibacterium yomogidense TaxID=946573 RepID=UPI0018DF6C13|nr:hypothetical protein [Brevibacterium yomogidense]